MKLNGTNFWSNGVDRSVFIDADDKILEEFPFAFLKTEWHPKIRAAFEKYKFDVKKDRMMTTNDTLNDAII